MLALHIPDGFIDGPTSLLAGIIAIAGIATVPETDVGDAGRA